MRKLVSSASALAADRAAEDEFGYPSWMLMEEAGIRLQDRLEALEAQGAWTRGTVAYLTGPGNNGGDAWAMARQSHLRGRPAAVVQVATPTSGNAILQANWATKAGVPVVPWPSDRAEALLRASPVWVDGLWGTGLAGPLRPDRARMVADLEALRVDARRPVAAVDVPSGLWAGRTPDEPVLEARWTLVPGPPKDFCFYPENRRWVGIPIEVPLAFPRPAAPAAELVEEGDLGRLVPPIGDYDHKGRRGHVALWGAAPGMSGALVLAARSAAAAGAGLVSLGVDPDLVGLVAPQVPAFQVRPAAELGTLVPRFDSLVVGPGWGRDPGRQALLASLWATDLPLVVDADGLGAWSALGRPSRRAPTVFTPHPGEFLRLGAGTEATVDAASALAQDRTITVVLKGAVTWVLAPDGRRAVWDGVEPALGTGGSGDCLAGVVGALLARGLGGFEAAVAAVALHGTAGRTLAREEGWFTADRLPGALAQTASACRTPPGPL